MEQRIVPLSTILSIHLQLPLADCPQAVTDLVIWMSHNKITAGNFPFLVEKCAEALRQRYPWLVGIHYPETARDAVWTWAWLDTQGRRHGHEHEVTQLPEDFWPPKPPTPVGFFCDQGCLHGVEFDELPSGLQQYLHSLGYQG
jgi:hypothetical protein